MVISDLAEVAVVIPPRPSDRWRLVEAVCAACGFNEVTLFDDIVVCASCFSRICVICGCVEEIACAAGCSWLVPGVCSTHEGDRRIARLAIPQKGTALALLN